MPDYAKLRTKAYNSIKKAGARVTFSGITTTVNHTTGGSTRVESTILGYAMSSKGRVGDSRNIYEELQLIAVATRTLLVAPDAGSDLPTKGMTVLWESVKYTVKYVEPLSPGGTMLLGKMVVSV